MKKIYDMPLGTRFSYDDESKLLTLVSLAGMTCGSNGKEDDFSCSGLAVIGVDEMRLEGAKLVYSVNSVSDDEFIFSAFDKNNTVKMDFCWKFEPACKIISCKYSLTNTSAKNITIRRALPRLVFSPGDYDVMWQLSRWDAENQLQVQKLCGADIDLHGRAARSTVGATPFCVLKDAENLSAVAFHVMPCGNWTIKVRSDVWTSEAVTPVVEAGLSDADLFMTLKPGESIELPEVLLQEISGGDILTSCADLHRYFIQKRLPSYILPTPVVYNGWLYRFTNFTREQLREQLKAAKEVGCEIFIIDAGWFGGDSGWSMVGDWREKEGAPFFGNMSAFADEVRAAGLGFGFWIEPERWGNGIPARKEHPEWFPENTTRIDLTQKDAAAYFHDVIADNVRKFGAKYIKVDFNASVGYDESGTELYNYCKVLVDIFKQLHAEFPDLIIENCGSGALRNDLASQMIYNHNFVSDNANPFETLRIRQGAIMRTLPGRILNWATMRRAPERRTKVEDNLQVLASAAATWDEAGLFNVDYVMISALLGIPGFSGDLAELPEDVRKRIAEFVAFYKENRDFISNSHCYLLTPPDNKVTDYEHYIAFQLQHGDKADSLVYVFSNPASHRALRSFRLHDLNPAKSYRVIKLFSDEEPVMISGNELMQYGLRASTLENQHIRFDAALYQIVEL